MTKPRQPLRGELEQLAARMHVGPPEGEGWEPVMDEHRLRYRRLQAPGEAKLWEYADPQPLPGGAA